MTKSKPKASDIDVLIGANLRDLRLFFGVTQAELARVLGVTFQQVQKYEKGKDRLSAARLYVLARFFDVPLDAFFAEPKDGAP